MRIIDEDGNEILNPDYNKGYTTEDKIFIAHHDAVPGVEEVGHYEVEREYPNGGKDVIWVVDVPGVEPQDAWDEYEDILRWHWFPDPESGPERAADNYEIGVIFEGNGAMYEATSNIAKGEQIVPGRNCEIILLSDILNALNSQGG